MIISNTLICKCLDLLQLGVSFFIAEAPSFTSVAHPSHFYIFGVFYPHLPFKHQGFSARSQGDCREESYKDQQWRNSISAYILLLPENHTHLPISTPPPRFFHVFLECKQVLRKSPVGDSNKSSLQIIKNYTVTTLLYK